MPTFRILGIAYGVVIIISAWFITAPPEGWLPDGFTPKTGGKAAAGPGQADKNWKQMLADVRFYLMILVFIIFATGGLMVVSQGSPMSQAIGGADAATAAVIVSVIAVGNTGGGLSGAGCPIKSGAIPRCLSWRPS